ncbi:MAG: mechanosensitive ion channel [Alphaproteobacteria bacterium]|nr:mechanosensitive ion channel [Alphaproteobacteria bacterium]
MTLFGKIVPHKRWAKWLLLLVLMTALGLSGTGYLLDLQKFLSQDYLTLEFGAETKITAWMALKTLLAVIVVFWCAQALNEFIDKRLNNMVTMKPQSRVLFGKASQIAVYGVAAITGLNLLGISLTSLAFLGGAVGIGLGFGLQKIASNFISGFILLFENSVGIDDVIQIEEGTVGVVKRIRARFTLVEGYDGREIMVPNEEFIASRVTNLTYSSKRARLQLNVGVSYDSDLALVKTLLMESITSCELVATDPAPAVFLVEFADNSVNFVLYFWVPDRTKAYLNVKDEVLMNVWNRFKAHNIEIPFPQRTVRVVTDEALTKEDLVKAGAVGGA